MQKILILVVGLVAGAGAVYLVTRNTALPVPQPVGAVPEASPVATLEHTEVRRTAQAPKEEIESHVTTPKAAPAAPSAWAKLAEKYGPEKTALSSKITSNITSVINQGFELASTAARNSGSTNIAQAATKDIMRRATDQLGLNEDQQKQASAIVQTAVEKRMGAISDLTAAMSSEPEQIMGLLLAGDALARKEITQEEYDQLTSSTRAMLQNFAGFVGGRPGAGANQMLADPETTAQINAILTPDQQTKFADLTAKIAENMQARADAQNRNGFPFQPGQIPVMELDRLDQSVAAVQQMTAAARQMMEAMKGFKDATAPTDR